MHPKFELRIYEAVRFSLLYNRYPYGWFGSSVRVSEGLIYVISCLINKNC